ncbi:MAG: hypothetical protein MK212_13470 [Saprospiraceae bacterium]|nr:hypothetical protein [Saprospiraceae bacterium]
MQILFYCLSGLLCLLLLPIILLVTPITFLVRQMQDRQWRKAQTSLEGNNLICYSDHRKGHKEYVQEQILPKLNKKIVPIWVDGRTPYSTLNTEDVVRLLWEEELTNEFPYLIKIREGKIYTSSIYNIVLEGQAGTISSSQIEEEIQTFFYGSPN